MKKSVVKNHFSEFAEHWVESSYEGDGYLYPTARHRTNVVCNILSELDSPSRIIDLGCGGGNLAASLAAMGHIVTGFDQSPKMISIAKKLAAGLDADVQSRLAFKCAELEKLPETIELQNAVTSLGVIGYLDDDASLFKAASSLLKQNGLFIVSCRNRLFNMSSISHRTQREIETGNAWQLFEQIAGLSEKIPRERVQEFARNLIAAGEAILRVLEQPSLISAKPEESVSSYPGIEARQHTPDDIIDEAKKHGFEMVGLHGVHPHLMQPHLCKLMPEFTYNLLSATLESLNDIPVSVGWSSVFVGVLRKIA